ncbi:hypothetical protein ACFPN1_06275 [Lysobacter yangpyeongensis]|uniref:Lipoprotein n=1 Tax=Lysobacter yangpyeongensis TaxID=346182 RepID=A0ABW0SL13_9GAMM
MRSRIARHFMPVAGRPIATVLIACLLLAGCNRERTAAPASPSPAPVASSAPQSGPAPTTTPAPADRTAAPSAALILPGVFAPDSTPDTLRRQFGDANVQIGEVPGAEGETARGVILFPDDPERRAYLYFQDASALRGLAQVRIAETTSQWRMDDGIAIGTPLAELVRRNGQPITFSGLGWDYGGIVQDLHGGALAAQREGPVMRSWRLVPRDPEAASADDDYPIGDGSFRSDDPRWPRQGETLAVGELWVSFPGEDDL